MERHVIFGVDLGAGPPAHRVDVNIGMRGESRQQCLVTELPASITMRIHGIADKRDNYLTFQCPAPRESYCYRCNRFRRATTAGTPISHLGFTDSVSGSLDRRI